MKRKRERPWRQRLNCFAVDTGGIAAVEFGLLASVLAFAAVGMADIGMAISQRVAMDQAVRAGAQAAMARTADNNAIRTIVLDAAGTRNVGGMSVAVQRFCRCPGQENTASCSTLCTGDEAPSIFVSIGTTYQHQAMLLPDQTLQSAAEVQVR
jgi:pilus assembly protein CpaE